MVFGWRTDHCSTVGGYFISVKLKMVQFIAVARRSAKANCNREEDRDAEL